MLPTKQTCPECGSDFIGSDALGDSCPFCKEEFQIQYERALLAKKKMHEKKIEIAEDRIIRELGYKLFGRTIWFDEREFNRDIREFLDRLEKVRAGNIHV